MNDLRLAFALAAAALAASCDGSAQIPKAKAKPKAYVAVTADEASWGVLFKRWSVSTDGQVQILSFEHFPNPAVQKKLAFQLTAPQLADFRRALGRLASYRSAPSGWTECGTISDPPYVNLRLGGAGSNDKMGFAFGCTTPQGRAREQTYQAVVDVLDRASAGMKPVVKPIRKPQAGDSERLCPRGFWYRGYPVEEPCVRK